MTVFQALVLGIVQGLGEFLPISSTAHLIIVPWLLGWPEHTLTFDVALHLGTLLAIIVFFWKDLLTLIVHGLRGIGTREGRLSWYLVVAAIPGGLAGLTLEKYAETSFRSPPLIAMMLLIMGLILYLVDANARKRKALEQVSLPDAVLVGVSQAFAIIPGVSRSGVTMTAGLLTGMTREATARFSFLLSAPLVFGAAVFKLRHITATDVNLPFLVGIGASAVVGALAIGFLLRYLRRESFALFVWYRVALAVLILATFWVRR